MSQEPSGSVALVTGATDGVGRGVAERLAGLGMEVHVHGRDEAKLAATAAEITAATGNERIVTHRADFASLAAVRGLADEVLATTDRSTSSSTTPASAPANRPRSSAPRARTATSCASPSTTSRHSSSPCACWRCCERSAPARIVNVASLGQAPIDFDDPMLERSYEGSRAYAQSKLAQISFTIELEARLGLDAGVTVNALHPNTCMPTKIVLEQHGQSVDSLEGGVDNVVRLAVAPELENVSGRFFDRAEEATAADQAYDAEARARLWALSEELTGESLS